VIIFFPEGGGYSSGEHWAAYQAQLPDRVATHINLYYLNVQFSKKVCAKLHILDSMNTHLGLLGATLDTGQQGTSLKVVDNEKQGGSEVWLLLEYGAGPWRSMSVYFFM
jgi:hypothetical protein